MLGERVLSCSEAERCMSRLARVEHVGCQKEAEGEGLCDRNRNI